jgi:hypothetical protein
MARHPLRTLFLTLLVVVAATLGWTEYRIRRAIMTPVAVRRPEGRAAALVVYHPGISALPHDIAEGFAAGLYGVLAAILLASDPAVWYAAPVAVAGVTAASIGSRVTYYWRTSRAQPAAARVPPRSGPRTGANAL